MFGVAARPDFVNEGVGVRQNAFYPLSLSLRLEVQCQGDDYEFRQFHRELAIP